MKLWKKLLSLYFAAAVVGCPTGANATTLLAVPSQSGLIVSADKLGTLPDGRHLVCQKIHRAGKYCIVGSTGMVVDQVKKGNLIGIMDVNNIAVRYALQHISDGDTLEQHQVAISQELMRGYGELLGRVDKKHWSNFTEGNLACTVVFFKYIPSLNSFQIAPFDVFINPELPKPIRVQSFRFESVYFEKSKVAIFGMDAIKVFELERPYDKRKRESFIQRSLIKPVDTRFIDKIEAVETSLCYIQMTHAEHPESVGNTVDVFNLNSNGVEIIAAGSSIEDCKRDCTTSRWISTAMLWFGTGITFILIVALAKAWFSRQKPQARTLKTRRSKSRR